MVRRVYSAEAWLTGGPVVPELVRQSGGPWIESRRKWRRCIYFVISAQGVRVNPPFFFWNLLQNIALVSRRGNGDREALYYVH